MLILNLCHFLSDNDLLNYVIVTLGIVELVLWLISVGLLIRHYKHFRCITKATEDFIDTQKAGMLEYTDLQIIVHKKKYREFSDFRKKYQKSIIFYDIFSQLIQLFTLLGILGTVAGLYIALNSNAVEGINIYEGVKFALSSTVFGLIGAVIFKFFDTIFTSPLVNYIDSGIEIYEKEYGVLKGEAESHTQDTLNAGTLHN